MLSRGGFLASILTSCSSVMFEKWTCCIIFLGVIFIPCCIKGRNGPWGPLGAQKLKKMKNLYFWWKWMFLRQKNTQNWKFWFFCVFQPCRHRSNEGQFLGLFGLLLLYLGPKMPQMLRFIYVCSSVSTTPKN